jgi:hypothetical protein
LTRHIHRGTAVRLLVLLVVGVLALAWSQMGDRAVPTAEQPPTPPPASHPAGQAAEQPVEHAATPLPTAVPAPVVQARSAKASRHGHRARHGKHHRRAHARHGRRHQHHQHHGRHHAQHHAKHHSGHHSGHHTSHHPGHHSGHHASHTSGHHSTVPRGAGRDIGWPQCPQDVGFRGRNGLGQPLPDPGVKFVIVGLTNGRAFTPNPCLDLHLDWVRSHHVYASAYAFATYPTRAQLRRYRHSGPYDGGRFLGALANAGHAAARYNIRVMQRHGFTTPHVWLDLEPSSSRPWSGRRTWNGAVVRGWVRAYQEAGYGVGFYSTTSLWEHIVGGLRFGLPEWRTAGPVSSREALGRCGEQGFQGGQAVISQWWTTHRDLDRLCPSASRSATFDRYFHKW